MTFLVINLTTGEEAASLGDLELAKQLADRLFNGEDPYWAVVEHKVVYRAGDALPPRGEELVVEYSPEAQAKIDADPKLAAAVRDANARIRQAMDGVATGRFADVDEAMRSIGAEKVGELSDDEEDDE